MLKPLGTTDSETSVLFNVDETISCKALYLRITATNGVTPATLEDIGRVRLWVNDYPVIDASFEFLNHLTNIWGGFMRDDSAASGALRMTALIPCGWKDNNVMLIDPSDNCRFEISYGGNYAGRTSATLVELYAVNETGIQAYTLTIRELSENIAAGQYLPKTYQHENICAVYAGATVSNALNLAGSGLGRIKTVIGESLGDATVAALTDFTQGRNNLEADYTAVAELYTADSGDFTSPSALEDAVNISWDNSGAASVARLVIVGKKLEPVKLAQTSLRVQANLDSIVAQKAVAQKRNDLDLIRKLRPSVAGTLTR